jgi:hypothetical protein
MTKAVAGGSLEMEDAREEFPGLCRICGGSVPPLTDPSSCTATLCSERCLAKALVAYWATQGVKADVVLREGYARLEGIATGKAGGA